MPTNTQSPYCTSNNQCRDDQVCDLTSGRCTEIPCPVEPVCRSMRICNHQCQLTNKIDGSFCIDQNNNYGTCQNGQCITLTPTPTPINSCSPEGSSCEWCPLCYYGIPPCLMPCRSGGLCQNGICMILSVTPSTNCPRKSEGDADCNGVTDLIDFEIWRREFTGLAATRNADYRADGRVDLIDFEIWRRSFLGPN